MDIRELRIGNIVKTERKDDSFLSFIQSGIFYVTVIGNNVVKVGFGKNKTDKISNSIYILGVPLTEEWLVKFDLIKVKDIDDFSIWMFRDIPFTYETERHFIMLDNKIIANCKYVHQLQNLYFALTGEELKKIN